MICPPHISKDWRKRYEIKKKGQGAKVLFRLGLIEASPDLQLQTCVCSPNKHLSCSIHRVKHSQLSVPTHENFFLEVTVLEKQEHSSPRAVNSF